MSAFAKKTGLFLAALMLVTAFFAVHSPLNAQQMKNPVLEFCTGTWCQWCPCGDSTIINQILPDIPNAIILAYHGPTGSSDPFDDFEGNTIVNSLGLTGYPTGVVDRVSGIVSWSGQWYSNMNAQNGQTATIDIVVTSRGYNEVTREYNATIEFTANETLDGEYLFHAILTEDHITWGQTSNTTCTPGTTFIPDYVHDWIVRDFMNGTLGETIVDGTWTAGETHTMNVSRTIPVPSAGGDIIPENCNFIVVAYKNGSPMNSNAPIQQAIQIDFLSPDYVVAGTTEEAEDLAALDAASYNVATIENVGLLEDSYTISMSSDDNTEWSRTFTTANGTFSQGETDEISLQPGETADIIVEVYPNGTAGIGYSALEYASANNASATGAVEFRTVTTEFDVLVLDDANGYGAAIQEELDDEGVNYAYISSDVVAANADVLPNNFGMLIWFAGHDQPALDEAQMDALRGFMDAGGSLFLSGLDIAYQLGDATSPYYTENSHAFLNDYLHSEYMQRQYEEDVLDGISGDIIGDGLFNVILEETIDLDEGWYPNEIDPVGDNAWAFVEFNDADGDNAGVRAQHGDESYVIFTTFGFEAVTGDFHRGLIFSRILEWVNPSATSIDDENNGVVTEFSLKQNYPNPFNPSTSIQYSLPVASEVKLSIYNLLGQEMRTLVATRMGAGLHQVEWNGTDNFGNSLASGVYVYRLEATGNGGHDYVESRKLVFLK